MVVVVEAAGGRGKEAEAENKCGNIFRKIERPKRGNRSEAYYKGDGQTLPEVDLVNRPNGLFGV